jgi:hypothetical protein
MKPTRREFTKLMGASLVAPLSIPGTGPSLWERAEREVEQTGEVSPEVTRILLDNQGVRGIYEEPEHFEELRAALARKIRDHKVIREFPIPADVEPILFFGR